MLTRISDIGIVHSVHRESAVAPTACPQFCIRGVSGLVFRILEHASFYLLLYGFVAANQAGAQSSGKVPPSNAVDKERKEFFALGRSDALRNSRAHGIEDRHPLQSAISLAIQHVTSTDEPEYLNCQKVDVNIVPSGGSRFHPEAGIFIDENQIGRLDAAVVGAGLTGIVLFVVAHECGHALQFKRYPRSVMEHREYTRFIECQADLLAGIAISRPLKTSFMMQGGSILPHRLAIEGMDATLSEREMDDWKFIADGGIRWSRLARLIGAKEWHDTTKHPPAPYRQEAVLTGLFIGAYLKYADEALMAGTSDSRALVEKWRKQYALTLPPLPEIGEDLFEWSRRATEKMLAQEKTVAEFPK
jgi:hypothetical protein